MKAQEMLAGLYVPLVLLVQLNPQPLGAGLRGVDHLLPELLQAPQHLLTLGLGQGLHLAPGEGTRSRLGRGFLN